MNIKRYITVNLDVLKGFKVQEKNKGSNELTMKYLGKHKETALVLMFFRWACKKS